MAGRGMMDIKSTADYNSTIRKEHRLRMQQHEATEKKQESSERNGFVSGVGHACETGGAGAGVVLPPIVASAAQSAASPRKTHGHRATDVTTKQNCAYVKWFQHQTTDESPDKCHRRLMYSEVAAQPVTDPNASRVSNVLLGGGASDFTSWSTTYRSGFTGSAPNSARF